MLMEEKRAFRVAGRGTQRSTTVRLEKPFWLILERMAQEEELTLAQLVARIEADYAGHDERNKTLASCLRVTCLKWCSTGPRSM